MSEARTTHRSRLLLSGALAVLAATLAPAASSSAYQGERVKGVEAVLKPNGATFGFLAGIGIDTEMTGVAEARGERAVFPIPWGHLQAGPLGRIQCKGGLSFFTQAEHVKFRHMTVRFGARRTKVFGVLHGLGGTTRFLDLDLDRARIGGKEGVNVKVMGAEATLAKPAAKVLTKRFGVPFHKGLAMGTMNVKAKFG